MRWLLVVILAIVFIGIGVLLRTKAPEKISVFTQPTNQPMATNEWFSSVYKFPSEYFFAYPGKYKINPDGIEVNALKVTAAEKVVQTVATNTCTVNRGVPLQNSKVEYYGDWHVVVSLTDSLGNWKATFTQGSPLVSFDSELPLQTSCAHGKILEASESTAEEAGIFFQTDQENKRARILLIPPQTSVVSLSSTAWDTIQDTQASSEIKNNEISTSFTWKTTENHPTLTTLWPHHRLMEIKDQKALGTYPSVIGNLQLIETKELVTTAQLPQTPITFSYVPTADEKEILLPLLKLDVQRLDKEAPPQGVYFKGTWLGSVATAVQIAQALEAKVEEEQLLNILEKELLKSKNEFHYEETTRMLVANHPEFGNEFGNDHHFHYGYYIRAFAVLVQARPSMKEQFEPLIDEMIQDIASTDRSNNRFPYLRSFSTYDGHSWADGRALFADGNNQESTSESLQAWYSISLWGQVVENPEYIERGQWLLSQELAATQAYWFGKNNPFPEGYKHEVASLVWGGKREFGTWFSPQPEHITGIQFLPLTPVSPYLKDFALTDKQVWGKDKNLGHEWADLLLSVESLQNNEAAKNDWEKVNGIGGLKLKVLLPYWIFSNAL